MIRALDPPPAAVANPSPGRRPVATGPPAPAATPSANLDFLRAAAVALVVQAHLFAYFGKPALWVFEPSQLGALGVVLFFVHTSLVLLQSLDRQHRSWGDRHFYLSFLVRRVFRIYPLSVVCVLSIAAFQIPQSLSPRGYHFELVRPDPLTVVTNLLLVQNFFTCGSLMDPLWSLPFEFQMYLVLPVLYRVVKRTPTTGPVVAMWAVAALAVVLTGPRFAKYNAGWAVFHLPSLNCVPCFLAGVLAYKASEGRTRYLPFVGLPALVLSVGFFYLLTYDALKAPLIALAVGSLLPAFRELESRWLRAACATVARYSYGIYLSHYVCIWFAFEAMGGLGLAARWSIFLAGAAALPVLMYHFIESPMIRLGNRLALLLCEPAAACPEPRRGEV